MNSSGESCHTRTRRGTHWVFILKIIAGSKNPSKQKKLKQLNDHQPTTGGKAVFNYTTQDSPQFTAKLDGGFSPRQLRLTDLTAKICLNPAKNGVLWKQSRLPFCSFVASFQRRLVCFREVFFDKNRLELENEALEFSL